MLDRSPAGGSPAGGSPAGGSPAGATPASTSARGTPLRAGSGSNAAETAPSADVSCRPLARAASSVSFSRVDPASRRAGTRIDGPAVISQTNTTPTSDAATNTSDTDCYPVVSITPAATGSATATPIPGPA